MARISITTAVAVQRLWVSRAGAALVSVAVSGCKVGPDYAPPATPMPEGWLADAAAIRVLADSEPPWWESFNDPALTALVQGALKQNLSLRAAGLRVIEARARRGIAVGEFFPQVQDVVAGVRGSEISANTPQGQRDRSYAEGFIELQAAWELDFWGRFRRGIEAADAEVQFTVADYDTVLISLAAEVATNYILIRSTQARLEIARENVALQVETLDLTEKRFRAGAVSELDVATARATLANTQALIPDLENQLVASTMTLCVLLGRMPSDLETELTPREGVAPGVPQAPPTIAAGIPADLLRRRPDVRAAERLAAAQCARIGVATADLYPSISIAGATGFASSTFEGERNSDLGDIFDSDSFSGFIGLQLDWPIFNYGRIEGNIRAQDALFEQAMAAYEETVLRAAAEVESGLSAFLRSREQADLLAESVHAAQRSTELSLIQYRAGAVDFIRVNDAQTTLVQQEDSLLVSRTAIALAAVLTYRALGGGWEVRADAEFVDAATVRRMRDRTTWGDILSAEWAQGSDLGFARPAVSGVEQPAQE
jgi:NodT family efflux transporter outer membrane factor (OMF) lipoprotein